MEYDAGRIKDEDQGTFFGFVFWQHGGTMARIRYLKPDFFLDEDLAEHPLEVRMLFAGLWCIADKAGRLEDRPKRIKAMVFPYDDGIDIEACLDALTQPKTSSGRSFIRRYVVNGQGYIDIPQWEKHQKPHRTEKESILPGPEGQIIDNPPYPGRAIRKQVYERDNFLCLYCGEDLSKEPRKICLDHVIPITMNGSNRMDNLATACKKCNAKKAGKLAEQVGMKKLDGLGNTIREATPPTPPDGQRTTDNGDGDGDGDGEPGCQHTVNVPSTGDQTKLQEVSTSTSSSPKETKSHKGSPADRILSAWQKLPLPPEKKQFGAADILAIERAISILAGDSQEPVHAGMILEAIENYRQALSLSDSQTYKHKLHPWLMEHVRKYVSYNFDIDHHRGSKYQKTGKTDTMAEMERLKAKGEL
jgi:hypothetical protein